MSYEDNRNEEEPIKFETSIVTDNSATDANGNFIELLLSRKAYQALHTMNSNPELTHIMELAHHTEHDQKHHLKVPVTLTSVVRHSIDTVLRRIKLNEKRGRNDYGAITVKCFKMCLAKLHG